MPHSSLASVNDMGHVMKASTVDIQLRMNRHRSCKSDSLIGQLRGSIHGIRWASRGRFAISDTILGR